MRVFGHRGYSALFPENTLISFQKAFEFGADGIELDVRETLDGEVVVFHDEDLSRIFGLDRKLKDMTFEELRDLSGQKVPTLEEVLKIVPEGGWVIVEIKEPGVASKAIGIVRKMEVVDRAVFSSFDHDLVEDLKKDNADLKLALLIGERHRKIPPQKLISRILGLKPHSIHIPLEAFTMFPEEIGDFLKPIRDAKIEVFVWNINEVEPYRRFREYIDTVITDEVEEFVKERDESTPGRSREP